MFWKIFFWSNLLFLLIPLPIKIFNLVTGRDDRSRAVKIEEWLNVLMMLIGLIPFAAYIYHYDVARGSWWWSLWCALFVTMSVVALVKSPKLQYAVEQVGRKATIVMAIFGCLFLLPMLIAVWQYGYFGA